LLSIATCAATPGPDGNQEADNPEADNPEADNPEADNPQCEVCCVECPAATEAKLRHEMAGATDRIPNGKARQILPATS